MRYPQPGAISSQPIKKQPDGDQRAHRDQIISPDSAPPHEHEAQEWQAAMEALVLVATSGGPTMFARIGVMRALNRHVERVFDPSRKDKHWGGGNWRGIDDARRPFNALWSCSRRREPRSEEGWRLGHDPGLQAVG